MTAKIISAILLILLAILQISFFSSLDFPFSNVNFILPLLIFLVAFRNSTNVYFLSLWSGLVLELYSLFPFGIIILSLLLTLITISFLFRRFFTSRSFFSLVSLACLGVIIYNMSVIILTSFIHFFFTAVRTFDLSPALLISIIWQIIFTYILLTLFFIIWPWWVNYQNRFLKFKT